MNISLCICTFNRSNSLAQTLDSLVRLRNEFYEGDQILIIDNNSSDNTKDVIEQYSEILPITYVFEMKQGLSAARNRALLEFINPAIIFIDDDVTVFNGFISQYRKAISEYKDCDFWGGRIDVDWAGAVPRWYQSNGLPLINGLLVNYDLGKIDKKYQRGDLLPYGASFALRRQLIESVGQFDVNLGVNGKHIGRGEESDYFARAMKDNFQGAYLANAIIGHRYDPERFKLSYLFEYGVEKGKGLPVKKNDSSVFILIKKNVLFILKALFQLMKGRQDRFYQCIINMGIEQARYKLSHQIKKNSGGFDGKP